VVATAQAFVPALRPAVSDQHGCVLRIHRRRAAHIVTALHLPASAYGLVFVLGGVGYALEGLVSAKLAGHQGIDRMVLAGASVAFLASAAMAGLLAMGLWTLWVVAVPSACVGFGIGVVQPND
jgi:MFS family permease